MSIRKSTLTILSIALLIAIGGAALHNPQAKTVQAQSDSTVRSITVTGNGAASGSPDIAYMSIGVDSYAPDIQEALADNNTRVTAIMEALAEQGIPAEDIRTDYFNIYQDKGFAPFPAEGSDMASEPQTQYRINNAMTVTVRDVSKVGEILGAVIEAGANMINGINFDIADRAALESEARIDALADARTRAEELATQLGVELGEVLTVTEYSGGGFYGYAEAAMGGGGGGGIPPISQGALNVNISLTVTYAIQ